MAAPSSSGRPGRPVLDGSMRGKSYLEEMQQYRPPQQDGHQGIDSMIEGMTFNSGKNSGVSPPSSPSNKPYRGIPSPHSPPPRVVESGMNHNFSHTNCQPPAGLKSDRMIATLFYKPSSSRSRSPSSLLPSPPSLRAAQQQQQQSAALPPGGAGGADRRPSPSPHTLPDGLAPTRSLSTFPLEPPEPDAEPLDHLYGSYVSPLCITSFLALISSLPLPPGTPSLASSHRCLALDAHANPRVVEIAFSPTPDARYLTLRDLRRHELLYRFSREWGVDVVLQREGVARRHPRLVVFDMDSTLIEQEVVDLVAAEVPGAAAQVSAITRRAMNGELDFAASLRERVALLRGVDAAVFTRLRAVVRPTRGARELVRALRRLGARTAVLSGGFLPLTRWLAAELGIDEARANTLGVDAATGRLTGEVLGPIVDAEAKRALMLALARGWGIEMRQTLAVGDGANDLLMLGAAGLGVAFCAKPRVQLEAEARLNGGDLLDLLYLCGFTAEEVADLTREDDDDEAALVGGQEEGKAQGGE